MRYPLFLAHYLVSTVRGGVETKGQRHQPTGHPATFCPTSPVSSTPSPSPLNAAATRSVTNLLRYPVLDVHYLIATARAGLLGAKFDTRGQDEDAKINETKDMLQERLLACLSLIRCMSMYTLEAL